MVGGLHLQYGAAATDYRAFASRAGRSIPVVDPRLGDLLAYWRHLLDGRLAPDRREFDPTVVAKVLPYFWILDRDPLTGRYRFALAGEETLRLLGRRLVGEAVEDVFPGRGDEFEVAISAVLTTPAVLHTMGPLYRSGNVAVHAERLALPMATGSEIDRVYGATVYRWPSHQPAGDTVYQGTTDVTIVPVADLSHDWRAVAQNGIDRGDSSLRNDSL